MLDDELVADRQRLERNVVSTPCGTITIGVSPGMVTPENSAAASCPVAARVAPRDDDLTPEQQRTVGALRVTRGACPPAETLIAYEALDPSAREKHAAHDHIQICSRCQLVLLHAAEPAAVQTPSSLKWMLPLAAILVLGIAITMVNRRGGSLDSPIDTVRGTEIQAIAPAGSIDSLTGFTWQSPIRAARYRVIVSRGSDRVWTGESTAPRVEAPVGVFDANVEYRWVVEAIDREGDVRMTSPPRAFTIRRAP